MSLFGLVDISKKEEPSKGSYHGSNALSSLVATNHLINCKVMEGRPFLSASQHAYSNHGILPPPGPSVWYQRSHTHVKTSPKLTKMRCITI